MFYTFVQNFGSKYEIISFFICSFIWYMHILNASYLRVIRASAMSLMVRLIEVGQHKVGLVGARGWYPVQYALYSSVVAHTPGKHKCPKQTVNSSKRYLRSVLSDINSKYSVDPRNVFPCLSGARRRSYWAPKVYFNHHFLWPFWDNFRSTRIIFCIGPTDVWFERDLSCYHNEIKTLECFSMKLCKLPLKRPLNVWRFLGWIF